MKKTSVRLLVNDDHETHGQFIEHHLLRADRFECLVAFASKADSGKLFLDTLKHKLKSGMVARIAVGLSMFVTKPDFLRKLFQLSRKTDLELFLSDVGNQIFHPKIYAFENANSSVVVVGSANLTNGGLTKNYEASTIIDDSQLIASVSEWFDELIEKGVLVEASKDVIETYAVEHNRHQVWLNACKRHKKRMDSLSSDFSGLAAMLEEMKADKGSDRFDRNVALRKKQLGPAKELIIRISELRKGSTARFAEYYEELLTCFHSGGVHRGKNHVKLHANQVIGALKDILNYDIPSLSPEDAYSILSQRLMSAKGVGVNIITELLHALDSSRFAVMNSNDVSGICLAGYTSFPGKLQKTSIKPEMYARFCFCADTVANELNLKDMTEIDALFNYCYWKNVDE